MIGLDQPTSGAAPMATTEEPTTRMQYMVGDKPLSHCPECKADLTLPKSVRVPIQGFLATEATDCLTRFDDGFLVDNDKGEIAEEMQVGCSCATCDHEIDFPLSHGITKTRR
jgi:hypothetical protein